MGLVALALYVHWPWCVHKCPYCDFNSRGGLFRINESRYIAALLADLSQVAHTVSRPVTSVFFGGGTPSLMTSEGFDVLMCGIGERVDLAHDAEITLEANPGTVTEEKLAAFARSGVTRLSLGVQSFNEASLSFLGRIHTARQAREAVTWAKNTFAHVNIDMMYALSGQTQADLRADAEEAVSFNTDHLSYYELTIEPGSVFFKRPPENLPDADTAGDMAECIQTITRKAGFDHYEVSAYAKAGSRCRHNMTYWTYGDYLAIGAGAHAKITTPDGAVFREVRAKSPVRYMTDVENGTFVQRRRRVRSEEIPFEFMLNVLRLREGVAKERWEEATGLPYALIAPKVASLQREGLMEKTDRLAATALGRRFLNTLQERFLP